MIRVLQVLADWRIGGPAIRIVRLQEGFERIKEEQIITLVASPQGTVADFFEKRGIEHHALTWHKPNIEHPIRSGLTWLLSGLRLDIAQSRAAIRKTAPSVVHVNGAILLPAVLAAWLENVPTVWHLNDIQIPRFMAVVVRRLASLSNARVIAASGSVVRYYGLSAETPIFYPPAPETQPSEKRSREEKPIRTMGVLANINPIKGIHDAVDAVGLLKDEVPDLQLRIAGQILETKMYYYEMLKEKVSALNLEDRVHFSGFVPDPVAWLQDLDFLVVPSESEAAGMAAIEAMTCGTPIIASDIPATMELAGDAAVYFPLGGIQELADAVRRLLWDRELYESCRWKGIQRSRALFSVERLCARYADIYRTARGLTG